MSYRIWQNIIYGLILLIVATMCILFSPKSTQTPHGILLPSGQTYPAINPKSVTLYTPDGMGSIPCANANPTIPEDTNMLGNIRISAHYNGNLEEAGMVAANVCDYAKTLAAAAGANGVIINVLGRTEQGPLDAVVMYAVATRN